MNYSEVSEAKRILRLPDEYVDSDSEIEAAITAADAWINGELQIAGLTLPTGTAPELLNQASQNLAAWFFRRRADPPVSEKELFDIGTTFLSKYLLANGAAPTPATPQIPLAYGRGDAV